MNCFRCGKPIPGRIYAYNGNAYGKSCYDLLIKRLRIREATKISSQNIDFIETDICKVKCEFCVHFNETICPQQQQFKGSIGRKR